MMHLTFRRPQFNSRTIVFTVILGMSCVSAGADESPPPIGYVALLSNYVGRGLAQSVGEPSLQAEVNYNHGDGLYAGLSASSINWVSQLLPGSPVSIEVDGWLGFRRSFGQEWTFQGGVLRLQFPGRYPPQAVRPDTTELFASVDWRVASAKLNYAISDSFGTPDSRGSWYVELSASLPIGEIWSAGAHVGRKEARGTHPATQTRNDASSYTDYKFSVTRRFAGAFSVDLSYSWTDAEPLLYTLNGYNVAGNHLRVALQKDF